MKKNKKKKLQGIGIAPERFDRSQIKYYIVLLPFIIYMGLPLCYIFFTAFKSLGELNQFPPTFITTRPTMQNFLKLFNVASSSNQPATRYLFNSIVITLCTMFLCIVISVCTAYVLSKKQFRMKKVIFKVNELSMMFVASSVAIPRYLIISKLGLLDTFWVHILPALAMPVGMFLLKQNIDLVPDALVEAARIDGASDYCIITKIIVPMIMPAISTVGILAFQSAWNSVEASNLYVNSESLKTFAFYLNSLYSASNSVAGQGISAAATLIMFVPNLVIFIVMQSKVLNTMANSGIK